MIASRRITSRVIAQIYLVISFMVMVVLWRSIVFILIMVGISTVSRLFLLIWRIIFYSSVLAVT